ncbi:DUF6890 family protein [Endozoicomonas lisbonensis]|uniref:DUF6890 family protein n=1 Tax=Endozoicomonas lisbonensis TaxID=3120522 RepID=UPI003AEF7B9D
MHGKKIEERARAIKENGIEQLFCFAQKWLPHHPPDDETLARALYLELEDRENLVHAVTTGTVRAWKGK